ncbi:hypothetical protein Rs2_14857 [Raphanus sativus]|nr:hypothetical protein Rs2_14857 [Raphanus sativus]
MEMSLLSECKQSSSLTFLALFNLFLISFGRWVSSARIFLSSFLPLLQRVRNQDQSVITNIAEQEEEEDQYDYLFREDAETVIVGHGPLLIPPSKSVYPYEAPISVQTIGAHRGAWRSIFEEDWTRSPFDRLVVTVRSLAITRYGSFSRGYSTRFAFSRLFVTIRSLAITRHSSFLSRLLSTIRSLAVTRHHSLSRSYSTPFALSRLLGTVRSLAITRHRSLSRSYLTLFALSRLLDTVRSLAVTRHSSLSRGYSARLDLLRLLDSFSHGYSIRSYSGPRLHDHKVESLADTRTWRRRFISLPFATLCRS